MSNTITAEQVSINAWCEQVRQIHADATRPMQDDDARLVELYLTDPAMWTPERLEAAGFGPSDLGELYFTKVSTLPAFPAPAPEWAVTAEFLVGTYPEVVICYYGQEWTQGDFTARIMQSDTVFVEDTGEGFRVSDLLTGTPTIDASPISTDMTLEQAMNASIALEDAVHEFARRVEVTE